MTIAQNSLRVARLIHLGLLFAAFAYLVLPLYVRPPDLKPPDFVFVLALGVVALSAMGAGIFIRARLVQPASERLRSNPEDAEAAKRWRTGVILSLVFCETVALFGFSLRFIGGSWNVCGVFYAVGIFFLLAWTPRLELPPT
jgi:F0F1-type ATP synthase membrane subunit c/vacuolar-type H+-ATPase subunit K